MDSEDVFWRNGAPKRSVTAALWKIAVFSAPNSTGSTTKLVKKYDAEFESRPYAAFRQHAKKIMKKAEDYPAILELSVVVKDALKTVSDDAKFEEADNTGEKLRLLRDHLLQQRTEIARTKSEVVAELQALQDGIDKLPGLEKSEQVSFKRQVMVYGDKSPMLYRILVGLGKPDPPPADSDTSEDDAASTESKGVEGDTSVEAGAKAGVATHMLTADIDMDDAGPESVMACVAKANKVLNNMGGHAVDTSIVQMLDAMRGLCFDMDGNQRQFGYEDVVKNYAAFKAEVIRVHHDARIPAFLDGMFYLLSKSIHVDLLSMATADGPSRFVDVAKRIGGDSAEAEAITTIEEDIEQGPGQELNGYLSLMAAAQTSLCDGNVVGACTSLSNANECIQRALVWFKDASPTKPTVLPIPILNDRVLQRFRSAMETVFAAGGQRVDFMAAASAYAHLRAVMMLSVPHMVFGLGMNVSFQEFYMGVVLDGVNTESFHFAMMMNIMCHNRTKSLRECLREHPLPHERHGQHHLHSTDTTTEEMERIIKHINTMADDVVITGHQHVSKYLEAIHGGAAPTDAGAGAGAGAGASAGAGVGPTTPKKPVKAILKKVAATPKTSARVRAPIIGRAVKSSWNDPEKMAWELAHAIEKSDGLLVSERAPGIWWVICQDDVQFFDAFRKHLSPVLWQMNNDNGLMKEFLGGGVSTQWTSSLFTLEEKMILSMYKGGYWPYRELIKTMRQSVLDVSNSHAVQNATYDNIVAGASYVTAYLLCLRLGKGEEFVHMLEAWRKISLSYKDATTGLLPPNMQAVADVAQIALVLIHGKGDMGHAATAGTMLFHDMVDEICVSNDPVTGGLDAIPAYWWQGEVRGADINVAKDIVAGALGRPRRAASPMSTGGSAVGSKDDDSSVDGMGDVLGD